jgi:hypothetical protein
MRTLTPAAPTQPPLVCLQTFVQYLAEMMPDNISMEANGTVTWIDDVRAVAVPFVACLRCFPMRPFCRSPVANLGSASAQRVRGTVKTTFEQARMEQSLVAERARRTKAENPLPGPALVKPVAQVAVAAPVATATTTSASATDEAVAAAAANDSAPEEKSESAAVHVPL